MDSSSGEQASSCPPRKLEVSVSSLLSEPMLDIDSATLELSLPEDAVRPIIHRVDSCHSQDWEDVEKFETFNDLDSNADSLLSNHNFPQHMDMPYLSDGHKFQDSAIDNFSSNTSNDDHLEQLVRNTENKTLFTNQELESMDFTKNTDLSMNLEDSKPPSTFNFAEKDNDCASTKRVPDSCENSKLEGAVDVRESEEIAKPLQAHPEYTENFNNYKVCRVIAPGVKECLILETGEQVKCDKRQKLKDIENNLRTLKRENSISVETTTIVACPPPPPPPPPPLCSSPDIVDHSAPTSTKLESNFPNGSPASASSDKENINFELCLSPRPRKNDQLSENSPRHSPLHDKLAKANSCDEVAADISGQDKLSKKVFKITKPHVEDSAVYFGNLKLGRGMNKGCPRLMFLGSCPRNKVSTGISQESKNEDKKEKRNPAGKNL